MAPRKYDLVVIGSGPAGEKGAAQAAYFGKTVALIEKDPELGGAAANTGTLPSKTLRETALFLSGFRQRELYGMTLTLNVPPTARDFLFHQQRVTESEHARIQQNLDRHKVDVYRGFASFEGTNTVSVAPSSGEPYLIEGDYFLIATGSRPHHPPFFPTDHPQAFDSDSILGIHHIPRSMIILGGGVIGSEYACLFAALGVKVMLVEGRDRLLSFLDAEIAHALADSMRAIGVELLLNEAPERVQSGPLITVGMKSGKCIDAESLLVAFGRTGNTGGMNLDRIGIKTTSRGQIEVNSHYQTSVSNIYAVGDVIGFPALASTSMEQARVAMVHAFDLKYKTEISQILPYGIYTIPECSFAGETEETLIEKKIPYVAGRARYSQNARGYIIGDKDGFLKLLFREDDMRLLGVSCIGEQASELLHTGLTALLSGATAELFIQMCFNYPTLSEMYKYATYDALGARAKRIAAQA
jgi:NAD(P) transhydrogenase